MNGKLFMLALVLGLANSLPTKNLQASRTRKNTAANHGLGIYDGKNTTIAKHNYLVGLSNDYGFNCAGVIISESYVLSLGYCTLDFENSDIKIVAGSSDGTTGTKYNVEKVIVHPSYQLSDSYNFALFKIKGTFTWGTDIGYATLPSSDPKNGTALVAAGYGDTGGSAAEGTLLQGTTYYVTAKNCESYWTKYDITFDSTMACVYNQGKTTMCYGDFGNPLTHGRVLYGMMADTGDNDDYCDATAIPTIIADVYTVVDWINKYI